MTRVSFWPDRSTIVEASMGGPLSPWPLKGAPENGGVFERPKRSPPLPRGACGPRLGRHRMGHPEATPSYGRSIESHLFFFNQTLAPGAARVLAVARYFPVI